MVLEQFDGIVEGEALGQAVLYSLPEHFAPGVPLVDSGVSSPIGFVNGLHLLN